MCEYLYWITLVCMVVYYLSSISQTFCYVRKARNVRTIRYCSSSILSDTMRFAIFFFLYFYEGEWGPDYYLEEYEEGFFSNFEAMLNTCLWIGIVLLVVGIVIYVIGKKTEGPQLKPLQVARKQHLDEMIRDLHDGKLPGED